MYDISIFDCDTGEYVHTGEAKAVYIALLEQDGIRHVRCASEKDCTGMEPLVLLASARKELDGFFVGLPEKLLP